MKLKSPIRFIVFLLTLSILVYVLYTVVSAFNAESPIQFGLWNKNVNNNSKAYQNIVVAGIDEDGYRTDLILFCQYNFNTNSINVLQIPRDTKVETKRSDKKINSAYGSERKQEALFDEIESVIGPRADKYVIVSFKAFREIIDAIGGVEVDVPMRMYYTDPVQNLTIDLKPGLQTLNGKQAEMFMRFRKNNNGTGYANGDVDRINAQKQFYNSVMDKLLSGSNILKAPKILGIIKDNVTTNLTGEEILSYLGRATKIKKENINIMELPGVGKYDRADGYEVSYFINDKQKTDELISTYFNAKSESNDQANDDISSVKNRFIKVELIDASTIDQSDANTLEMVKNKLSGYGFNIAATRKSDKIQDSSKIIEHNSKNAANEILKVYNSLPVTNDEDKNAGCDLTIVIGNDFNF